MADGNRNEALLGVWKLVEILPECMTGQTHLVIRKEDLWEVWPHSIWYEGEPGPERTWDLTWEGSTGRLKVNEPGAEPFCYLLDLEGDRLRLRLGFIQGTFADSLDDKEGTTLYLFEREGDPAVRERLALVPEKVPQVRGIHPALGEMVQDKRRGSWKGRFRGVAFSVAFKKNKLDDPFLGKAHAFLESLDFPAIQAFAAGELVDLKNEAWLDEEGPIARKDLETRLRVKSLNLEKDLYTTVALDDDGLFWGHSILVDLDGSGACLEARLEG